MLWKYIKKILDDIIDVAYPGQGRRFKGYKLYLTTEEKSTYSGVYYEKEHKIEIYNMSLGVRHVAKCCLHELSHHIDTILNGTSGHQKPFYEAYTKLIYASLDMGILTPEDFEDFWSRDRNKVKKIVEKYEPHPVDYVLPVEKIIKVKNCYDKKTQLKENGYIWNNIEQVWEKELEDEDKEIQLVESLELTDYKITVMDLYIEAVVYIVATGKTYDYKEELRRLEFYYSKRDNTWKKKTNITGERLQMLLVRMNQIKAFNGEVRFALAKRR